MDNYDSFVYNLVQYIGQLGAEPVVHRNDAITVAEAVALGVDGLLVSPGPGRPENAGVSEDLIAEMGDKVPVLGVCLGHQCIGDRFGASVVRHTVMHGKTSQVTHDGRGVFAGLANPIVATRYHSLVVGEASVPAELEVVGPRRGRHCHGPAPPVPADRGRPVSPRVDPHRGGTPPRGQLACLVRAPSSRPGGTRSRGAALRAPGV